MPRKSTVKRLPPDIRDAVHRLLDSGRTLDEIRAHLEGLGADVSRSALGRYAQKYEEVAARLREAREVTTAFAKQLEDLPSDMGRVLTELLQSIIFKLLLKQHEGEDPTVSAEEVMFFARSFKDVSSAMKSSADMEMKIRDRVAAEAKQAAVRAVDHVARERGLTRDTVEAIKSQILGIRPAPPPETP